MLHSRALIAQAQLLSTRRLEPVGNFDPVTGGVYRYLDITVGDGTLHVDVPCTIEQCRLLYWGNAPAIRFTSGAQGAGHRYRDIDIVRMRHPLGLALPSSYNFEGIRGENVPGIRLHRIRGLNVATLVYLQDSDNAEIGWIKAVNLKGGFPRGQLAQLNRCTNAWLHHFLALLDDDEAWPEDVVSVFDSNTCLIEDGLIVGAASPTGWAVLVENGDDNLVRDVYALRPGNGGFAIAANGAGKTATGNRYVGCHVKDLDNTDRGRGAPSSGGRAFAAFNLSGGVASANRFEECTHEGTPETAAATYFEGGTLAAGGDGVTGATKPEPVPLALDWPWQDWTRGPFALQLNGPNNDGAPYVREGHPTGHAVGRLFAVSGRADETFTFEVIAASPDAFEADGDQLVTTGAVEEGPATITVEVTGSRGGTYTTEIGFDIDAPAASPVPETIATTSVTATGGAAGVTVNRPAGVANGDWIFVTLGFGLSVSPFPVTPPAGFTTVFEIDAADSFVTGRMAHIGLYRKRVADIGSEPASYTFGFAANNRVNACAIRISGASASAPVDAWSTAGSDGEEASVNHPSVTTIGLNRLMLAIVNSDIYASGWTPPAGFTGLSFQQLSGGINGWDNGTLGIAWGVQPAAGASGAKTSTLAGDSQWCSALIAIAP